MTAKSSIPDSIIYLIMILLVIMIFIPPLTRIFFKEETNVNEINNNSATTTNNSGNLNANITSLVCKKAGNADNLNYNTIITSTYANSILNKVTFYYQFPASINIKDYNNQITTEINTIRNSGLVSENQTGNNITLILTKESIEANNTNTTLSNYFNDKPTQRTNLEALGYSCQEINA